ncbi:hypothetical protein CRG98_048687, partial [Punica granatum]
KEGSRSPIGRLNSESTKDSESEVPGRFKVRPPIDDPDPSTEVAGILRGY